MKRILLVAFAALAILAGCSDQKKDKESENGTTENIYQDEKMVRIAELQDKRDVDGLVPLMKAKKEKHRVRAALAHGSIRDPEALPYLYLMLQTDKEIAPRRAAAWAIGQIGDPKATKELLKSVGMELDYTVLAEILEAVGKCANDTALMFLQKFENSNPTLTAGHAAGIFRSLFKIGADSTLVAHSMDYLNSSRADLKTKFFAAQYLGRVQPGFYANDIDTIVNMIADPATSDSLRLPLIAAINFSQVREDQFIAMEKGCNSVPAKAALLRLLLHNPTAEFAREKLFLAITEHDNKEFTVKLNQMGLDMAGKFKTSLVFDELPEIENEAYWPIYKRAGITNKEDWDNDKDWDAEIKKTFETDRSPYVKIKMVDAIPLNDWTSIHWFKTQWDKDTMDQRVRNAVLQGLLNVELTNCKCLDEEYMKGEVIMEALRSGDVGAQSLACYKIEEEGFTESQFYDMRYANALLTLIDSVRDNKSLPMEQETWYDLTRARNNISGAISNFPGPKYNHPVNWEEVKKIPVDQKVMIETNKGNIELQLHVNEAPGTVWNFLELVDSGYYDGKYFHRVIPNFVIQGGCPRGDGWGGLEWSQRSEFDPGLPFIAGAAGIASAGPDTEGVQFFITHYPVPHLDGRYSVFAEVIEGMDVVQMIGVGDQIKKIYRIE